MEPLPAIFDGFYEMVGELGRGATGTVYEARHKTLKRRVALKVPGFSSDAEQLVKAQRFLCECRALAHLTSVPGCNIPRLLVVTEYPEGRPYCVRELVEGSTLEQRIADGSIGLRAGLAVVAETVRVVEWVHAQGFAHRNLSPSNVLVDRDGSVWLIGFGRVGLLAGSPLAPAGEGTAAEVDAKGLRNMVRWLCGALLQPVPAELDSSSTGPVGSVGALGAAVARHLRMGNGTS